MPAVEMMPPMTQHIKAMPGLPESLRIVAGVEKMLGYPCSAIVVSKHPRGIYGQYALTLSR